MEWPRHAHASVLVPNEDGAHVYSAGKGDWIEAHEVNGALNVYLVNDERRKTLAVYPPGGWRWVRFGD